ncbi:MAG: Rab family GTPase [Candidatus Sigynarchaeota archaeon]
MQSTVKIVIGGAGGVGKTTYLHRFIHGNFFPSTALTIGVAFVTKTIKLDGHAIVLQLWDLGGQDRFRTLQPAYVRGARAGIVFFDMSMPETIFQVADWVSMFRNNAATPSIPIVLGGTKLDCVPRDQIGTLFKTAADCVAELGLTCFVPTSSKDGTNVDALMDPIVKRCSA